MGLLYCDSEFAIIEEKGLPFETVVKILIRINVENPNFKRDIKPLLGCCPLVAFVSNWEGMPLSGESPNNRNYKRLGELGYEIVAFDGHDYVRSVEYMEGQTIVSVAEAVESIVTYADMLQYLAKLHLLASGDRRMETLLDSISYDKKLRIMSLAVVLPIEFKRVLLSSNLPTPACFDASTIKDVELGRSFSVDAKVLDAALGYYPSVHRAHHVRDGGFLEKRLFAASLLSSLLCYRASIKFEIDADSYMLKRSGEGYVSFLGDAIIEGKVTACPHCGRPIYKPRASSMNYCSDSCRTLYNRAAHNLFNSGANIDEVKERFPFVNIKTIESWG